MSADLCSANISYFDAVFAVWVNTQTLLSEAVYQEQIKLIVYCSYLIKNVFGRYVFNQNIPCVNFLTV